MVFNLFFKNSLNNLDTLNYDLFPSLFGAYGLKLIFLPLGLGKLWKAKVINK